MMAKKKLVEESKKESTSKLPNRKRKRDEVDNISQRGKEQEKQGGATKIKEHSKLTNEVAKSQTSKSAKNDDKSGTSGKSSGEARRSRGNNSTTTSGEGKQQKGQNNQNASTNRRGEERRGGGGRDFGPVQNRGNQNPRSSTNDGHHIRGNVSQHQSPHDGRQQQRMNNRRPDRRFGQENAQNSGPRSQQGGRDDRGRRFNNGGGSASRGQGRRGGGRR